MANPIDTIYGYIQGLTSKRDANAMTKVMESVYPRRKVVNLTAAETLSELKHGLGRIVTLNNAAAFAVTLPASTGQGAIFRIFIGTTVTSVGMTIKVANASDTMVGFALLAQDGGDTSVLFGASGTDDTITLNGTTTGGTKGDYMEIEDVALNLWSVRLTATATSAEATPFSATVS